MIFVSGLQWYYIFRKAFLTKFSPQTFSAYFFQSARLSQQECNLHEKLNYLPEWILNNFSNSFQAISGLKHFGLCEVMLLTQSKQPTCKTSFRKSPGQKTATSLNHSSLAQKVAVLLHERNFPSIQYSTSTLLK